MGGEGREGDDETGGVKWGGNCFEMKLGWAEQTKCI